MKRIFKSISILTLTLLLLLGLSVGAYADSEGQDASDSASATDIELTDSNDGTGEAKNPFSVIFDEVMAHSAQILSALTLIGSLVLAFAYRKGLMPIIQNALSRISGAVESIRGCTDSESDKLNSIERYINESLESVMSLTEGLCDRIETLNCEIGQIKSDAADREAMLIILNAQIDMMYDVFMTSALPQYQKDSVGKKILKMKEALAERAEK